MARLRTVAACVVVAAPVAALALLDPAFGASAVGGAAATTLTLSLLARRASPAEVVPLTAVDTAVWIADTQQLPTGEPVRVPGHLHLETSRFADLADGWEDDMLW